MFGFTPSRFSDLIWESLEMIDMYATRPLLTIQGDESHASGPCKVAVEDALAALREGCSGTRAKRPPGRVVIQ